MMARLTSAVTTRFPNSIMAEYCQGATRWCWEQVGQSLQPRPDPVRRTAAPVTMMNPSAQTVNRQTFRYVDGDRRRLRPTEGCR